MKKQKKMVVEETLFRTRNLISLIMAGRLDLLSIPRGDIKLMRAAKQLLKREAA